MTKNILILTTLIASAAYAAVAYADREGKRSIDIDEVSQRQAQQFNLLDQDNDNVVTQTEFESAKHPGRKGMRNNKRRGFNGEHGRRMHGQMRKGSRSEERKAERQARRAAMQDELFTILDKDGDGNLSRAEAGAQTRDDRRLAARRASFKRLDANGDGQLTQDELPDRTAKLRAMDADGDGTVTRSEIRAHRQQAS